LLRGPAQMQDLAGAMMRTVSTVSTGVQPETWVTLRPETWVTVSGGDKSQFGVPGVDPAEQEVVEVHLEALLLDFDEADSLAVESPAEKILRATEGDVTPGPRCEHFVPGGILGFVDAAGKRSW